MSESSEASSSNDESSSPEGSRRMRPFEPTEAPPGGGSTAPSESPPCMLLAVLLVPEAGDSPLPPRSGSTRRDGMSIGADEEVEELSATSSSSSAGSEGSGGVFCSVASPEASSSVPVVGGLGRLAAAIELRRLRTCLRRDERVCAVCRERATERASMSE